MATWASAAGELVNRVDLPLLGMPSRAMRTSPGNGCGVHNTDVIGRSFRV